MMIKIERSGNGFKVAVSEPGFGRFSEHAENVQEAANAVIHYYGGYATHQEARPDCPFCRRDERRRR